MTRLLLAFIEVFSVIFMPSCGPLRACLFAAGRLASLKHNDVFGEVGEMESLSRWNRWLDLKKLFLFAEGAKSFVCFSWDFPIKSKRLWGTLFQVSKFWYWTDDSGGEPTRYWNVLAARTAGSCFLVGLELVVSGSTPSSLVWFWMPVWLLIAFVHEAAVCLGFPASISFFARASSYSSFCELVKGDKGLYEHVMLLVEVTLVLAAVRFPELDAGDWGLSLALLQSDSFDTGPWTTGSGWRTSALCYSVAYLVRFGWCRLRCILSASSLCKLLLEYVWTLSCLNAGLSAAFASGLFSLLCLTCSRFLVFKTSVGELLSWAPPSWMVLNVWSYHRWYSLIVPNPGVSVDVSILWIPCGSLPVLGPLPTFSACLDLAVSAVRDSSLVDLFGLAFGCSTWYLLSVLLALDCSYLCCINNFCSL